MEEELIKLGLSEDDAKKVSNNIDTLIKDKYVPLTRFNQINTDNKEKDKTITKLKGDIEDIKGKVGDNEKLKQDIIDLQKAHKEDEQKYNKEKEILRKETAIKLMITGQVHDIDDVVSKLDLSKIELEGDTSKIKSGFTEQYENLKKEKSYLFIPEKEGKESKESNKSSFIRGLIKPKEGIESSLNNETKSENAGVNLAKTLAKRNTGIVKGDDYYFGGNKEGGK